MLRAYCPNKYTVVFLMVIGKNEWCMMQVHFIGALGILSIGILWIKTEKKSFETARFDTNNVTVVVLQIFINTV